MARLPDLHREDFDHEQLALYERIRAASARVGDTFQHETTAALLGPFNVFLHAPELGAGMLDFGALVNDAGLTPMAGPGAGAEAAPADRPAPAGLSARTTEIVIMTVGAHWQAEFEWWGHMLQARVQGVDDAIIEAIAAGRDPEFDNDADRVMHAVARQLVETGHIDDGVYAEAEAMLGRAGLVKVIGLCGYYTMVAFLLNGFDVDLPPGEATRWRSPR